MSKISSINKDKLEQLYIVEGKCYREIADILNSDYYTVRNAACKYGLNIKKQGTSLRKESSKNGTIYLYGVENVGQLDSTKQKIKETSIKRYGIPNPGSNKKARKKAVDTALDRYGRMNNIENYKHSMVEKYGVPFSVMLPQCQTTKNCFSSENLKVSNYLDYLGVDYEIEFNLENRLYDFRIKNYLLEINPFATHNCTWGPYNNPKNKYYHQEKSKLARKYGFLCVHIFDWDDYKLIIKSIIEDKFALSCIGEPIRYSYNYKTKKVYEKFDGKPGNDEVIIYDSGEQKIFI